MLLPLKFPIPLIGIRFYDLFIIIMCKPLLYKKDLKFINHKLIYFFSGMFLFSFISLIGLYFFTPSNMPLGDMTFHTKNIIMGSIRYLEILMLFWALFEVTKKISIHKFINYTFYAIVVNDIYAFIMYLYRLSAEINNIATFIITGRFIHYFRFFESTGSVNASAIFLIMTLPIIYYFKVNRQINSFLINSLYLFHIFLIFLTGSKAGMVGVLVFYIILFLTNKKLNILKILIGFISLMIILGTIYTTLPEPIKYRIDGMIKGDKSTSERLIRAKISLNILTESPVFGYGYSSTYKHIFEQYAEGEARNWIRGVGGHNSYVTLLVQIGIIGFLFFIFSLFILIYDTVKILLKRNNNSILYYVSISIFITIFLMATDDALFVPIMFFSFFWLVVIFYILKLRERYIYE